VDHRLYAADVSVFYERYQRPAQQGFAADPPELLGQIAARGAGSPPCGDNDGGDIWHAKATPSWRIGFNRGVENQQILLQRSTCACRWIV
jgi:hypothetical protein